MAPEWLSATRKLFPVRHRDTVSHASDSQARPSLNGATPACLPLSLLLLDLRLLAQCHGATVIRFRVCDMVESVGVTALHLITLSPYHTLNLSHTLFVFLKIISFYLCNRTALF